MYFSQLPDVYIGEGVSDTESFKYRLVKNIFRRVRMRPDMDDVATSFEVYALQEDDTPESLSYDLYDNGHYDWVILLANDIIDFYDQWPKAQRELISYVDEKYEDTEAIHHYETKLIRDSSGKLIQPAGLTVPSDHSISFVDNGVLREESSLTSFTF